MSVGSLPPGAENDIRAPYNLPMSIRERFGDQASAIVDDLISELDDSFREWCEDELIVPASEDVSARTLESIYNIIKEDEVVQKNFHYYKDEMVMMDLYEEGNED